MFLLVHCDIITLDDESQYITITQPFPQKYWLLFCELWLLFLVMWRQSMNFVRVTREAALFGFSTTITMLPTPAAQPEWGRRGHGPPPKQTCQEFSLALHINFNWSIPTGRRYLTSYPVVIGQKLSCDIEMIFVRNSWRLNSDDISDWPLPNKILGFATAKLLWHLLNYLCPSTWK